MTYTSQEVSAGMTTGGTALMIQLLGAKLVPLVTNVRNISVPTCPASGLFALLAYPILKRGQATVRARKAIGIL